MNPEALLGDDYAVFSKQSVQESVNLTSIIVKDTEVMSYFDNRNTVFFCVFCLIMKCHYDRLLTDNNTDEVIRLNTLILETTKEVSRKMGISFDDSNNPLFSKYTFISKSVDRILKDKEKLGLEGDDLFCYILSVLLSVEASLDKEKAFEFSVKLFASPNFEETKKFLIENAIVQISKNPERLQKAGSIETLNSYRAREESQTLPSIEEYKQAVINKRTSNDVVALFYNETNKKVSFVCFTMFDRESISCYLDSSDGKAISYRPEKQRYWYLQSESDNNLLFFRQGTSKEKPFEDIDPINDFNAFLALVNAADPD